MGAVNILLVKIAFKTYLSSLSLILTWPIRSELFTCALPHIMKSCSYVQFASNIIPVIEGKYLNRTEQYFIHPGTKKVQHGGFTYISKSKIFGLTR